MLKKSFLFNLILIALLSVGMLILFFNSLNWLTNHGKQVTVPMLMGKKMEAAVKELKKLGFRIEIDSTYQSYKDPLEVLFQEPAEGSTVKLGRTIFLTVNRRSPPSIEMPNLVNMSFRNAILTMKSYNLEMGDTSYRPDVAAGAVLEQWVKGKPILAGTLIPFGTRIDLVVGEGLSGEQEIPNLIGMKWGEAKSLLESLSLNANTIWEGTISDSDAAIVYMQQPESLNELDFKNSIPEGDIIDLQIMQNPSRELLEANQPGSKKLMGEEGITDSNEVPIARVLPENREVHDSSSKKKLIPGMKVNSPSKDQDKKNSNSENTRKNNNGVKASGKPDGAKPKPKPAQAPSPKTDNISEEFN